MGSTYNLDVAANRKTQKYSRRQMGARILWAGGRILFRYSPRPLFGWRSFLLRLFGATVGKEVHIYNTAVIYMPWNLKIGDWSAIGEEALIYNLGKVCIGERTTISHRVHICAGSHDYARPDLPLLKPPVVIGDQAWICTDAFVGPGVSVGEGAIVGARAVAIRNVDPWMIVAGNPAKTIKTREMVGSGTDDDKISL